MVSILLSIPNKQKGLNEESCPVLNPLRHDGGDNLSYMCFFPNTFVCLLFAQILSERHMHG